MHNARKIPKETHDAPPIRAEPKNEMIVRIRKMIPNMLNIIARMLLNRPLKKLITPSFLADSMAEVIAVVNHNIDNFQDMFYPLAKRLGVEHDGILGTGRMARRMGAN